MRTLAALTVFLISLLGLGATLSAQASDRISIEPAFEAPSLMDEGALARGKKDGGKDDEESEEDLAPGDRLALNMLDTAAFDELLRLRLAKR